ncbi:MAG: M23 family metallopeptidase [Flexistipes sinusarabici]|uniref:M23 family metallopeptidase n=1 Tax=Flexistipes sinusarabici TaxID=2352 RepID=A0A5D0MRF5_FLESI|nr:M23 family metallopeptidase [Flexistipes sinusarabici]TYB34895.1 MAG: M23 family metallopeptidase [Flexistipes sinusarabici]
MKRKLTLMIFDDDNLGSVKTKKIDLSVIKAVSIVAVLFVIISSVSFYLLFDLYSERQLMLSYKKENKLLKLKIAEYADEVDEIQRKIVSIDKLENQVRTMASKSLKSKKVDLAVGGKEVDLLRDFSAVAERKEKQFFEDLNETLMALGTQLEKREKSLAELVNFLEEQKITLMATPSIKPVDGWYSSEFGYRISPFTGRRAFHEGVDIAANYGSPVKATANGIVIYAGYKPGYGNLVTVDHGFGYVTRYGHNSKILVNVGDRVEKGQVVSKVGNTGRSTGPHCHYEVLINGIPVNPLKFINDIKLASNQ